MLNKIKTQIAANEAQIKEKEAQIKNLEQENEKLKNQLAEYIKNHPEELMNYLLGIQTTKTQEPEEKKLTIVSVRFNNRTNRTYDYLFVDEGEPVHIGDHVMVDTPYQGLQNVEVMNVREILEEDAEYDYKEARLAIDEF